MNPSLKNLEALLESARAEIASRSARGDRMGAKLWTDQLATVARQIRRIKQGR